VLAQRRREPVGHVDVLPTILDLVGLPTPQSARGRSLRRALVSAAPLSDVTYFCGAGFEVDAYRGSRFLRVHSDWSAAVDYTFKSGRANVEEQLIAEDDITALETFHWDATGPWRASQKTDERLMGEILAYWREQGNESEPVEIPPEELERLRALGYVPPQ
jgi:hypothetical protein